MFPRRCEASEPVLRAGLAGAILGIGLRIDGGTQLLGNLGTEVGDRALDLPQKALQLIFLRWLSLVLGLLVLLVLLRGSAMALAAISVRVLIRILVARLYETLLD